jgi:uncharacterized membrane protein
MQLRSPRERLYQTLTFEAFGLLLVVPMYSALFAAPTRDSIMVIVTISVAVMLWSPIHNTVFDLVELRRTGRVASDRPSNLRIVHALSHELSALVLTLPIMIHLGGHNLQEAVLVDLGLTIFYTGYAYVFHLFYDRLRPVQPT